MSATVTTLSIITASPAEHALEHLDQQLTSARKERDDAVRALTRRVEESGTITSLHLDTLVRRNAELAVYELVAAMVKVMRGGDFPQDDDGIVAGIRRAALKRLVRTVPSAPTTGTLSAADMYGQAAWSYVYAATDSD
jgi:hypothetical protein